MHDMIDLEADREDRHITQTSARRSQAFEFRINGDEDRFGDSDRACFRFGYRGRVLGSL